MAGQAVVSPHGQARPRHDKVHARRSAMIRPIGAATRHGEVRRGVGQGERGTVRRGAHERCDTAACALRYGHVGLRHGRGLGHDTALHGAGGRLDTAMCARLGASGHVVGLWAMHLVHSASFLPGLTQYCT